MKFKLRSIWEDETGEPKVLGTVELPDSLPGPIGDEAEKKLNAQIDAKRDRNGRVYNANINVTSAAFTEVKKYLAKAMLGKYTQENWDLDQINQQSLREISRHYFNQLDIVNKKKAGGGKE